MDNVSVHEGNNFGGLNPVYWIFKEDLISLVYSKANWLATAALSPGVSWNVLYATPETVQVDGEEQQTLSGMKYVYKITMQTPKDRNEVELILRKMNNRGIVVLTQDKNGTMRIFGTPDYPMKKTAKLLIPKEPEGYNGYQILFQGEFPQPALFYGGSVAGLVLNYPPDPGGGASTK